MQAFVLAAGLGTRLQPLTLSLPKAMVEVQGRPLIRIVIDNLVRQGITRIVVNVHHLAAILTDYLQNNQWGADIIISDESDLLLDTGGGLKKAAPLFLPDEPILIHNVDILSRINFSELETQHTDSMNIATLAVSNRNTSRQLLFNAHKQLVGWQNNNTGETKWTLRPISDYHPMAFSGIAIVNPELIDLLPNTSHPFPIIPAYLEIAKEHRISYFEHKKNDWLDVGQPKTLQEAQSWTINH